LYDLVGVKSLLIPPARNYTVAGCYQL